MLRGRGTSGDGEGQRLESHVYSEEEGERRGGVQEGAAAGLLTEAPPLSGGPRKTLAGARTRRAHTEERAGPRERENFGRIVRRVAA